MRGSSNATMAVVSRASFQQIWMTCGNSVALRKSLLEDNIPREGSDRHTKEHTQSGKLLAALGTGHAQSWLSIGQPAV